MFTDQNKWYPGCPPLNAMKPSGLVVYRIVEIDPPGEHDFQSQFELGKPLPRKVDHCRWRALSIYTELIDARTTAAFLKGRRNLAVLYIAQGKLEQIHGVVSHTPCNGNSHHSWWPCDNISRLQPFIVVEQI
jgi:hypothetical protein